MLYYVYMVCLIAVAILAVSTPLGYTPGTDLYVVSPASLNCAVGMVRVESVAWVVNSVVESVGFELLCLIQEHTNRLVETRDYIESKYDCVPSNANYVLLKNEEPFFKHFRYKIINGLHRLSLTDPNTFKVYESFSDVH